MSTTRWLKLVVSLGSLAIGYYIGASLPPRSSLARSAAIGFTWASLKTEYGSKQTAALGQAAERFLTVARQHEDDAGLRALAIVATVAGASANETSGHAPRAEIMWEEAVTLCGKAQWKSCTRADLSSVAETVLGGRK